MDLLERAGRNFQESMLSTQTAFEPMQEALVRAAETTTQCLLSGGKLISCGHAGASLNAQYLASLMLGKLQLPRPALPAICLCGSEAINSAIAGDAGSNQVFANQLLALGQQGDVLFTLDEAGDEPALIAAIRVAHDRGMTVIALSAGPTTELSAVLTPLDIAIRVPGDNRLRLHELQTLAVSCICDLVDNQLLGPA